MRDARSLSVILPTAIASAALFSSLKSNETSAHASAIIFFGVSTSDNEKVALTRLAIPVSPSCSKTRARRVRSEISCAIRSRNSASRVFSAITRNAFPKSEPLLF